MKKKKRKEAHKKVKNPVRARQFTASAKERPLPPPSTSRSENPLKKGLDGRDLRGARFGSSGFPLPLAA